MNDLIKWLPSLLSLFLAGFNVCIFIVVKFNDLNHLQKAVDEVKKILNDLRDKTEINSERIAEIEGRCKANHG